LNYLPCNLEEIPDFDEIVIFNPDQILPRYLCYYENVPIVPTTNKIVAWVTVNTDYVEQIKAIQAAGTQVKLLNSSNELMSWLETQDLSVLNLRIISDQIREGDGEEAAGERLCRLIKTSDTYKHIPFLIFCKILSAVPVKSSDRKGIWVTASLSSVHLFSTEPIIPKKL